MNDRNRPVTQPPSDSPQPLLVFAGVEKSYDGQTLVVRDLDLEVRRGEFLTLLGPSGSGKTTTLMMLAGFEQPSGGSILLEGRPITDVPSYKRHFGMVFQNYALFPHMTVRENLAFPLRMHRFARAEIPERVARALDIVQLGALAERKPAQLSGGQQQRVALARALVFEPTLVLMDEPLGALDKQLREQMQIEIKHIHERLGITMIYVTHDQSEALTMSDRVAVFHQGRIQQIGTPSEIYDAPSNAFVASFIGENNALEGTVAGREAGGTLVALKAGGRVLASGGEGLAAGSAVLVSVRPERIALGSGGRDNGFPARVVEAIYFGDHTRLVLELEGVGQVNAKLPRADGQRAVQPGEEGIAGWSLQAGLVLPLD